MPENISFNFGARDTDTSAALETCGSGEGAMALQDALDACKSFESVNVLSVILFLFDVQSMGKFL